MHICGAVLGTGFVNACCNYVLLPLQSSARRSPPFISLVTMTTAAVASGAAVAQRLQVAASSSSSRGGGCPQVFNTRATPVVPNTMSSTATMDHDACCTSSLMASPAFPIVFSCY